MFCQHVNFEMNRRDFFGRFALGMGGMALFGLLNRDLRGASPSAPHPFQAGLAETSPIRGLAGHWAGSGWASK